MPKDNVILRANRRVQLTASYIQSKNGVSLRSRKDAMSDQNKTLQNLLFSIKGIENLDVNELDVFQVKALRKAMEEMNELAEMRVKEKTLAMKENSLDFVIEMQEVEIPKLKEARDKIIKESKESLAAMKVLYEGGEIDFHQYLTAQNDHNAVRILANKTYIEEGMKVATNRLLSESARISINNMQTNNEKEKEKPVEMDATFVESFNKKDSDSGIISLI